jgi:hypothetical protein
MSGRQIGRPSPPKLTDAQRALIIRAVELGGDVRIRHREYASAAVLECHGLGAHVVGLGGVNRFAVGDKAKDLVESWRCGSCGHLEYHCPASGCNHADDDGWCACDGFVAKVAS